MLTGENICAPDSTQLNLQHLTVKGAPRGVPDRADHAQASNFMAPYTPRAAVLGRYVHRFLYWRQLLISAQQKGKVWLYELSRSRSDVTCITNTIPGSLGRSLRNGIALIMSLG